MKFSLQKKDKLRFKSEFDDLRRRGVKTVGSRVVLITASAPLEVLRCGVICGRKFNTRAVVRNRARRLLWESFRLLKPEIKPGSLILLIPRQRILASKQPEVQNELKNLLAQAGFLESRECCSSR